MTAITITQLYEILSAKVGKETAENLTTFIENKINQDLESKIQHLATKEDMAKLEARMAEMKSELVRWSFIFWAGQMVIIFGLIMNFLKK